MNEIYLTENLYELLIFAYEFFSFSRGNGYFESILQEKAQKKQPPKSKYGDLWLNITPGVIAAMN